MRLSQENPLIERPPKQDRGAIALFAPGLAAYLLVANAIASGSNLNPVTIDSAGYTNEPLDPGGSFD